MPARRHPQRPLRQTASAAAQMVRPMDHTARHRMPHAAAVRHRRLCLRALLCTTHHGIPLAGMAHGGARRALHGVPRTTTTMHTHHDRCHRTQIHTQRQTEARHARRGIRTLCARTPRKQMEPHATLRVHHHTARRSQTAHAMGTRMGAPLEHIFAVPAYIGNLFIDGWTHRWKYTDKVWNSPDIIFILANLAGAVFIHLYTLQ